MSSRNVLVVTLDPVSNEEIRSAIETREEFEDVSVLVVAPAAGVGPLQWLTGAEDEARAEAEELADRAAHAVEPRSPRRRYRPRSAIAIPSSPSGTL